MISDLDNTLKQLLLRRVPLDPDEVDISFECPKREWSSKILKPTISLYLFDIRENLEFRASGVSPETRRPGPTGRRLPPIYVDLSYFITTWAREVSDEHLLLWRVAVTMMREPRLGDDVLQGAFRELGPPIRTLAAQADGVLRNSAEFWSALDNDLKPAVVYTATVKVDLDILVQAPLVLTKLIKIGDMAGQHQRRLVAIGGTVLTGAGADGGSRLAVSGATVAFPLLGIQDVMSGKDGRFVVPEIPEGRHRVRVTTAAGELADREIEVPSPNYDLEV